MIVINHRPRLHNLLTAAPTRENEDPSGAQHVVGAVLLPGANEIPDSLWAKFANDPVIQAHIDDGDLEVPAKDRFQAMPVREAVALVKGTGAGNKIDDKPGTTDLRLLRKWLETEKRKPVVEAIEAQIKAVELKAEG